MATSISTLVVLNIREDIIEAHEDFSEEELSN